MIIISLQYHKLQRENNESAKEWMGSLRTKAAECQCKEYERLLTEQFIRGQMVMIINKILKEGATLEDTESAESEHVLLWVCRVEGCKNQPLMT